MVCNDDTSQRFQSDPVANSKMWRSEGYETAVGRDLLQDSPLLHRSSHKREQLSRQEPSQTPCPNALLGRKGSFFLGGAAVEPSRSLDVVSVKVALDL